MNPPQGTVLNPLQERAFREWYAGWAQKAGLDPDPDSPLQKYDYRGAFLAGSKPELDPSDGLLHWPSTFKSDDHPNRFVGGQDTKAIDSQPNVGRMNEILRGMNPAGADAVTRRQPGVYGQMAGPLLGAAPVPERSPVDEAVDFIAKEEGFRREAYKDLAGAGHPWTVGYGRTGPDVGPETVMEEPEAREWLADRVRGDSARLVNMGLPANPGLLSFVYNAGHGRLRSTGAVEAGLRNDWDGVADALRRVTFGRNAAHEKVQLPVLVRRREAEIDLLLRDVLEGGSKSNVMDQDQR